MSDGVTESVPDTRPQAVNPARWPRPSGYANAVLATGPTLYLAGMVGWNATQQFETDDFVGQVRQALLNIVAVLEAAGAGPEQIVRMTWFIADRDEYRRATKEVGAVYREVIGRHFPAMSVVEVRGFVEDRAKVEIEATAVLPSAASCPEI